MPSSHCTGRLYPGSELPPGDLVHYQSRGALLLICDEPFDPTPLRETDLPGTTVLVSPESPARGPAGLPGEVRHVGGRISRLDGWLGAFRPELVEITGDAPDSLSPKRDGTFDLVIDMGKTRLIRRSVLPYGYFTARNAGQLTVALAACKELVGAHAKPKYFNYDRNLCAHASFGQAGCTRCLEVCGAAAIRSEGDRIVVTPELCQGCAACTVACPTGALSFREPGRETLLERLEAAMANARESRPVLVVHPPGLEPAPPESAEWVKLMVEPVAAFGEELWFAALARGAAGVLLSVDPESPAETAGLLAGRVSIANALARACGLGENVIGIQAVGAVPGAGMATENIRQSTPLVAAFDGAAAQTKRALLNDSLKALEPSGGHDPVPLDPGAPLGAIAVDPQRCTLCSACAKICPTAAIRYVDELEAGRSVLSFLEAECVQCGACANGCPEHAIRLEPRFAPASVRSEWRIISEDSMAACADCGQPFLASKLMAASLRRLTATQAPMAAVEQLKRCPDCRHRRIVEG